MADLPALESLAVPARWRRVAAELDDLGCDALVVTNLVNIRYLTGFTGSNATLVVRPDALVFITDGRYRTQADEQLEAAGIGGEVPEPVITDDAAAALASELRGVRAIGVEADDITWATQRRWAYDTFPGALLVPTSGLVLGHRAIKDTGEISRLHRASAIADSALAAVEHRLHDGLTEAAFARELEDAMANLGSDGPSFETIVASGPNGAKPHHRPSDRVIGSSGAGELVVIDFGATVDGYHSDMTRTKTVGELSATQREMCAVVAAAQAAGRGAVSAGATGRGVDAVCRDHLAEVGWGEWFTHGTGHGIGLEIHESPRLSTRSNDTLTAGHCVTVEPGVYHPDHGGVRVEDSLVVTGDGAWTLTNAPY